MGLREVEPSHGLIIVITGDGKGKTTAAFGQVLRAVGHGWKVAVIQFFKQTGCGEIKSVAAFSDLVEIIQCGSGKWIDPNHMSPVDQMNAFWGWGIARDLLLQGAHQLIVLDEIMLALQSEVVPPAELIAALQSRPAGVSVMLTGRNAPLAICEAADIVSEVVERKHCFYGGVAASAGLDY